MRLFVIQMRCIRTQIPRGGEKATDKETDSHTGRLEEVGGNKRKVQLVRWTKNSNVINKTWNSVECVKLRYTKDKVLHTQDVITSTRGDSRTTLLPRHAQ